ncbi:MAG TPA: DUF5615 family PIN-like protein [Ignavibacteria bacterium]|nr:DUF5615 family PIN-like protein [Ignavibacteria bacterium]
MIIADENIDFKLIRKLRSEGFEVLSIKEQHKGISDYEIIQIAKKSNGILITEDSDFGEWVFAHNITGYSVIFLRYHNVNEYNDIETHLLKIVGSILKSKENKFITITKNKIRTRVL